MTFALVLFGGTFYWQQLSHKNSELPPKKDEIRLPIQTLKNTSFTYVKSYIGTVQAIQSVNIVPYLSGFLKEVLVQSGQEVKKGETLFMLDQRIPLADLNQAKEASQQAKATRENALTFYERMKNTQEKAISPTELEQAKAKFQEADAAYQRALAAQNQGKKWGLINLMFANNKELTEQKVLEFAKQLNLDVAKLQKDAKSDKVKNALKEEIETTLDMKIYATPTYIINGKRYEGIFKYPDLEKIVVELGATKKNK